jgi:ribosomal protein S18 acetylase RimI-like enzyme
MVCPEMLGGNLGFGDPAACRLTFSWASRPAILDVVSAQDVTAATARDREQPGAGVVLRRIRPADADGIRDLTIQRLQLSPEGTFGASLNDVLARREDYWREFAIEHSRGALPATFVLDQGGSLVGCATLSDTAEGPAALSGVYVRATLRRTGLGRALAQACLDWAREQATDRPVQLWVAPTNTTAIALYRDLGFEPTGTFWASESAGWTEMLRPAESSGRG